MDKHEAQDHVGEEMPEVRSGKKPFTQPVLREIMQGTVEYQRVMSMLSGTNSMLSKSR